MNIEESASFMRTWAAPKSYLGGQPIPSRKANNPEADHMRPPSAPALNTDNISSNGQADYRQGKAAEIDCKASEPKLDSVLPFQKLEISCSLKQWPYQSLLLVPDHLCMAFCHKSIEERFQR